MARLRYFERDEIPAEVGAMLGDRPPLNLYRILPHAPGAAVGFLTLGRALLRTAELDPRLRELVILRVGSLSHAAYEIHQHRRIAASVGLSAGEIAAALRERADDALDPFQRLVLHFTDAVVWEVKAPEHLYRAVAAKLPARQLVELLMTIGFYMLVSRFLENTEVDIETAAPPSPTR